MPSRSDPFSTDARPTARLGRATLLATVLLAGSSLGGVAIWTGAEPGFAFVGNGNCPHNNDSVIASSSACQLNTQLNRVDAYISHHYAYVPPSSYPAAVRRRIGMFGGAPCTNFLEIGEAYYGSTSTPFRYAGTIQNYSGVFSEFTYGGTVNTSGAVYTVWYSSSAGNGTFSAFANGLHVRTVDGIGQGGCMAAAGTVVATNPSAGVGFGDITAFNSFVTDFTGTRSNSTTFTSWSDAVIDRPCSQYYTPCMNGAFYSFNQRWDSNLG